VSHDFFELPQPELLQGLPMGFPEVGFGRISGFIVLDDLVDEAGPLIFFGRTSSFSHKELLLVAYYF
jgi:hypothetical protein